MIRVKLGYADDAFLGGENDLGTALITSSSVLGMVLGGILCGKFI